MREILFRGKRLDNGEWVYGFYVCLHDHKGNESHRIYTGFAETDCGDYYPEWFEVDPTTVGQYTGLPDKNGKRIFEGDVVRFMERRLGGKDVPVVEVVEFSEGGFATNRYFLNNWLRDIQKGNTQLQDIEVIGNIYDSELLEVTPDA